MQYPNKIKKNNQKVINYGNRGMDLENCINESNDYYREKDLALIYKKPTPIGINKASYNEHGRVINEGYFLAQSTLDYNGLYKEKYIEFDAKETRQKTSFPLNNIHPHQIKHIKSVLKHGGIVFLLIKMNGIVILFPGSTLIDFINNNERKSIPYDYIIKNGTIVNEKITPALDYLKAVDEVYFKKEN